MAVCLLDINVLIGRVDTAHEHHARVTRWWHQNNMRSWATCPMTENGFIRILGRTSYPGWPGTPEKACRVLRKLIDSIPGHRFFADNISILSSSMESSLKEAGSSELTDLYLLALAVHHKATFVTLDTRIKSHMIQGGKKAYTVIA